MEKEIEFHKEKEEHRKEARENLPSELQLEFPQKRPEKEKWSFEGKLLKLLSSQEPADTLFLELLRLKIKERLNKEIKEEEWQKIKELKERVKQNKEKQAIYLENIAICREIIEIFLDEDLTNSVSIALELAKLGEEGMVEKAKEAMEKCFAEGRYGLAGPIALELAKLGKEPKGIIEILDKHRIKEKYYSYTIIAYLESFMTLLTEDSSF